MVISDAFPILNYVTQFSHIWSDMIFTGTEGWNDMLMEDDDDGSEMDIDLD